MKRREFFEKSACSVAALVLAKFGLSSSGLPEEEMSREEYVKKLLMDKMGMSEEEAKEEIEKMKEKLPKVKEMCICKDCPTYVDEETEVGFCHPLIGKSKVITEENGCNCPTCPVYKNMGLKNGYYCTRKSEMEQEMAKKEK
ncbi:MAG TPA: DUF2769 domain-containing protein [Acidobacteriota bacterium]|nr:DUF2769 domain-containing protein [Acidobacteriota bacterium]